MPAPRPHVTHSSYTIHLRADKSGYTMEGSVGPVAQIAIPILDAAEACEDARD
ncbi:hypothetical protein [Altericroceibacterium xinjiangense]|uniref:hypothetical protein n=1 Tax=Altericroceibacterium xinjiangense TaxID=762261 RepID=UPI0013DFBAA2|nr:hypothetical protein [Altericroceibacterium xinjiangense]